MSITGLKSHKALPLPVTLHRHVIAKLIILENLFQRLTPCFLFFEEERYVIQQSLLQIPCDTSSST